MSMEDFHTQLNSDSHQDHLLTSLREISRLEDLAALITEPQAEWGAWGSDTPPPSLG
jgi:hypothetical protein